jgi:hypothetical protein
MMNTMLNRVRRALSPTGLSARVLISVVLTGAIISACDVHGITSPGTLMSITVTPNATLAATSTQQMTAVGYDADGRAITIAPTWSVVAGGTINSSGLYTAGAVAGVFPHSVVASVGSISGNASITVVPGAIASITVVPSPVTLAVTATQQFVAVAKDAGGNIVAFTPTWSVVAAGGAIDQNGVFTAGNTPGTYTNTVQASHSGILAFATVIVTVGPLTNIILTPNPDTLIVGAKQQFVATGKDAGGNTVAIAAVWSVVAGGGTVDGGGIFTAGAAPGTFTNTIKATSGTLSATATVVVTAGPLAFITVTPNPATMAINTTQQLTAVGTDLAGNIIPITPTWAVVTTSNGASITSTGLYTSGTLTGTFINKVRASSGLISGFATIIVTNGPLANITVTPNPVFMPTNSLQQFLAVGKDASGNVFLIKPVWSVVNGGGVIDTLGNFRSGVGLGTFNNTIQATSGAISGFATVNVGAGPLATITVTPNPSNLNTGGTQTFTAVGKDALGNVMVITPVWSVVNATAGSIDGTGLFTAGAVAGTYINTVQAKSGGISGFATVNVAGVSFVDLGAATSAGILGATAITCGLNGTINADVMLSPGAAVDPACIITGTKHIDDATAIQAQIDMNTAYNTLMGLPCPGANVESDLAGRTFTAGVYCTSAASQLLATGGATLDGGGDPNAVFVFQVGSSLTTTGSINLIGRAQAKNVYWVVGASATIGGGGWQGNILAHTTITLNSATTLVGRALAHTGAVTIGTGNITLP